MTVWQNQPVKEQLSVDEALKQVKKGMGSLSRKLLWGIVAMIVAIVNTFIILFFLPWSWLTNVGISIILVTMLSYVAVMIRDYRLIHRRDVTINPSDYLQNLKEYRKPLINYSILPERATRFGTTWIIWPKTCAPVRK